MFQTGKWDRALWYPLVADHVSVESPTIGSERYFYRWRIEDPDYWQDLFPNQLINFKVNGENGPHLENVPNNVRIVSFHGRPRPHEVAGIVEWVDEYWTHTAVGTDNPIHDEGV